MVRRTRVIFCKRRIDVFRGGEGLGLPTRGLRVFHPVTGKKATGWGTGRLVGQGLGVSIPCARKKRMDGARKVVLTLPFVAAVIFSCYYEWVPQERLCACNGRVEARREARSGNERGLVPRAGAPLRRSRPDKSRNGSILAGGQPGIPARDALVIVAGRVKHSHRRRARFSTLESYAGRKRRNGAGFSRRISLGGRSVTVPLLV
jgi:hypothetical protein